jgi:hypothetical protein
MSASVGDVAGETGGSGRPTRPGIRLAPSAVGVVALAILLGTVGVAAAAGSWSTSGRTAGGAGGAGGELAAPGDGAGQGPGAGQGEGGGEGQGDGAGIGQVKGWMKIGDVADAYAIPLAEVLAAFGLPADTDPSTPLRELESDRFTVPALRAWLDAADAGSAAPAP